MARVGDTCVSIGNVDWYRGDSTSVDPVSVLPSELLRSTIGNAVFISGDSSYTEDSLDVLYYDWDVQGPVGYIPVLYSDRQESIRIDPEVVGEYIVTLSVVGANGGCGNTSVLGVYAFSSASPQHEGTALDFSYIWQLLPTAWSKIERDPRLKIELYWRGLAQLLGAHLTKAMTLDANKSLMSTMARTARRHIEIPLSTSIREDAVYISPLSQQDTAEILGEYSLEISSPASSTRPTYSFEARIVSENSIEVRSGQSFQPYPFDIGSEVRFSNGANLVTTRVSDVVTLGGTRSVYILADAVASVGAIGAKVDVDFEPRISTHDTFFLAGDPDSYALLRCRQGASPTGYTVSAGRLDTANEEVAIKSAVFLKSTRAWRNGVRRGDIASFSVKEVNTGAEIGVDLKVAAILHEASEDYIALLPLDGGSFTSLLEQSCLELAPNLLGLAGQIKSYLDNVFLPRASGHLLLNEFSISIRVATQPILLKVSLIEIKRRTSARVHEDIRELSVLREFIEVHEEDPSGQFIITEAERALFLGRRQITLLENKDFTLQSSGELELDVSYTRGNKYFQAFEDVSDFVGIGDYLVDTSSVSPINRVVNKVEGNRLFVSPLPASDISTRPHKVFYSDGLGLVTIYPESIPYPALPKLWAEAVTIEDVSSLEARLGEVTGLRYSDWLKLNTRSSYLSTLRAMYMGYIQGPTLANLESAANAVLGAPYTDERVVIESITYNFKTIGEVGYAKVIAEVIDSDDQGVGVLKDYLVPTSAKYAPPGAISEEIPFEVGDIVEAGVCLSGAISVVDHALRDHTATDRHKFSVRLASSALPLSVSAIDLISEYIHSIKPAHTDFSIQPVHYVADDEEIVSTIDLKVIKNLFETPYGLHGPAEILDDYIPGIGKVDTRPFMVLSTWFPDDGKFNTFETPGGAYAHVLSSDIGGFISPLDQYTLVRPDGSSTIIKCAYDSGSWIKQGDAVVLPLVNDAPHAIITEVVNDSELKLDRGDLKDYGSARFIIVRFIDDVLLHGHIESASNAPNINIIELGARASNVSRGDTVSFNTGVDAPRPITRMAGTRAVLATVGYQRLTGEALDAGSEIRITRPWLRPINCGEVSLNIAEVQSTPSGSGNYFVGTLVSQDSADIVGIRVGDILNGVAEVIAIDADRAKIYLDDKGLGISEGVQTFTVENPSGVEGADSLDLAGKGVDSSVMFAITFDHPIVVGTGHSLNVSDFPQRRLLMETLKHAPGAIIKMTSAEVIPQEMPNVGEGPGVYRFINMSLNATSGVHDQLWLNVDLSQIPRTTRVYITLIKQNRTQPVHITHI